MPINQIATFVYAMWQTGRAAVIAGAFYPAIFYYNGANCATAASTAFSNLKCN
jgi:hypothetical protein